MGSVTVAAVTGFVLVQTLVERGLATLDGDPLRLRSEGVLGLLGTAALVGGISVLRHIRHIKAARALSPVAAGTRN
jgi:hypothetical protein